MHNKKCEDDCYLEKYYGSMHDSLISSTFYRTSRDLFPQMDHSTVFEPLDSELLANREVLLQLMEMLDPLTVNKHYVEAMRGLCNSGLFGLSLMMVASLVAAALMTILVCVDSHTWIYLTKR